MDFETKYEIEKDGFGLVLEPEGDSSYVFRGINFHSCGRARYGVSIEYRKNKAGGVLLLDDVVRLRDFLNKHIETVARLK